MTLLLQFQVRHHSYKSEYKVCQHNGQQYSQWIGNNPHIGKCQEASGQPKDKFISLPTITQLIRVNTRLILTKIWQYQCKWRMINSNSYPSIPFFYIHHLYSINTPYHLILGGRIILVIEIGCYCNFQTSAIYFSFFSCSCVDVLVIMWF
jgi:hypothetical protein